MKKRFFAAMLTIAVLLSLGPITVSAATADCLTYTISNGEVTITDCDEDASGELVIPDTIEGVPVTAIGDEAFRECTCLERVTIGDGVTTIGKKAFYDCEELTSVTIPDSVTFIGEAAFGICDSLSDVYFSGSLTDWHAIEIKDFNGFLTSAQIHCSDGASEVPDGLAYEISDGEVTVTGFSGQASANAAEELVIPDVIEGYPVTAIADNAFQYYGPDGLKRVTIGDNVTTIGNHAFSGNNSLTSLTIGNSVTTIGDNAFLKCTSLESVTIPDSVTAIGDYSFCNCDSLKSVTFGDGMTTIGDYAFNGCDSLTSVTIPDNMTAIGSGAFMWCYNLTSVTIGDGVLTIGSDAFYDCDSLTSVTLGDSVTTIGVGAFYSCGGLTSVTIPDSVTTIGAEAFIHCASLESVTIGDGKISIGDYAFSDCTSLESLTLGDSVIYIGVSAFDYCSSLTSVTIPDSVNYINSYAFNGCTSLESVTIGDGVTHIGWYTFSGCDSLESVTIGDSVTTIGESTFSGTGLTSVTIPDSMTVINDTLFYNCTSLESVTIPDSVTTIGSGAFELCSSLTDIYYSGTEADWNAIENNDGTGTLASAQVHYNSAVTPDDPSAPADTDFTFTDDTGSGTWGWASQYIYAAHDKGIFKGDNNGCFNPDDSLTRAEAVTALLALKGAAVDTSVTISGFTDADGSWYTPYVAAAKAAGISSGYDNGDGTYSFRPNANITRAEFVTMLLAAMDVAVDRDSRTSGFTDADNQWYSCYVAAAKENGLSSGYDNGNGTYSFKPTANIIRAESATMTANVKADPSNSTCTHSWIEADCTTPRTCSVCGATEGSALGHDWQPDSNTYTGAHCNPCHYFATTSDEMNEHLLNTGHKGNFPSGGVHWYYTCSRCGEHMGSDDLLGCHDYPWDYAFMLS